MELTVYGNFIDTQYERETKLPLIAVSAKNASDFPTGALEVMVEYDHEPPQAGVQNGGQQTIPGSDQRRRLAFDAVPGGNNGPLEPGGTRVYVLHGKWMQTVEAIVNSLPPEHYRLVISNNGECRPVIAGAVFADYVRQLLRFMEDTKKGRLRFRQKKCDCTLYLYRPDQGESLESTEPLLGVIHLVEVSLGTHPFWFGIIELPLRDDDLHRTFIEYWCDLVLDDGRQAAAVIVRVFAREDYMAICVSGRSLLAVPKPQQ